MPHASEALRDALLSNREKLVESLDRTQDKEDARHTQLVDLERERHTQLIELDRERLQTERERLQASRESSQALVGELNAMANAMTMLGQSFAPGPPR